MMVFLNVKQRTEKEFRWSLMEVDERFEVVKVHSDGPMGLVEVQLRQCCARPERFRFPRHLFVTSRI